MFFRRLLGLLPLGLLFALLLAAPAALEGARAALSLWWRVVVPSLLPFFIISQLLLLTGCSRELGRLLSPLMRPLFYLPGSAGLGVAMGLTCGSPSGALVTMGLYRQGELTAEQAGRLLAFTNNAGPLYICAAVGLGLLGSPQAGWVLAGVHYGLSLVLGMILGLLARGRGGAPPSRAGSAPPPPRPNLSIIKTAAGEAALTMGLIGCYMSLFSVLAAVLADLLPFLGPVKKSLLTAGLEMSLGVEAWASLNLPLNRSLPLIAATLGWGGLSIQAQVLSVLGDAPLSPRLYLITRPLHALASGALTAALTPRLDLALPALAGNPSASWNYLPLSAGLAGITLILTGAGILFGRKLRLRPPKP